jgi:hypothetical protein
MDSVSPQVGTVTARGVRLVGQRTAWPSARSAKAPAQNADGTHHPDEVRAVGPLTRTGEAGDRTAPTISDQVNLGGQAATGTPQPFTILRPLFVIYLVPFEGKSAAGFLRAPAA